MDKKKIRLFACGGCGVNIVGKFFEQYESTKTLNYYGEISPVLVDTSKSNLPADQNIPEFILDGVDGSGKVRRENSTLISESIGKLLLERAPLDLNLVVFSASGGSGSVFGPLLVRELLLRNTPVVVLVVGSGESKATAKNTHDTFLSLAGISQRTESSVVVHYVENQPNSPKATADTAVIGALWALAMLGSGLNSGLDSKDLENFFRFEKATSLQPRLALLDIYDANTAVGNVTFPDQPIDKPVRGFFALAALFGDQDGIPPNSHYDYYAEGYLPKDPQSTAAGIAWYYTISADEIPGLFMALEKRVKEYDEISRSRAAAPKLDLSSADDSGMVL